MNFVNLRTVECFFDTEKDTFLVIDEYGNEISIAKKSFDRTYKSVDSNLSFSEALYLLKKGYNILRKGWKRDNSFLVLMHAPLPIEFSNGLIAHDSYIAIRNEINTLSPYVPSSNDLFAEDWLILKDK